MRRDWIRQGAFAAFIRSVGRLHPAHQLRRDPAPLGQSTSREATKPTCTIYADIQRIDCPCFTFIDAPECVVEGALAISGW
jgi:hypothetical protein